MPKARFTGEQITYAMKKVDAGKPVENAYKESFNGRHRKEKGAGLFLDGAR